MSKKLIAIMFLATLVFAKTNVVVSIVPQKSFVEKIGGEFVNVDVMIPIGADPHSYEPKPSQMRAIANGEIYMKIGLAEFENSWIPKFLDQNKKIKLEDISKNATLIELKENEHHHDEAEHNEEKHHDHGNQDPHIWMSPKEVKNIAKNIFEVLSNYDQKHKDYYKTNYEAFLKEIDSLDKEIREILKDVPKNQKIMVFHHAFGYFARDYNLIQFAIEFEGKEPKPKMLMYMISEAKEEKIKTIITEPEFSDKTVKIIATEVKATVKSISPLAPNWSENLEELAKIIASSYKH